MLRPPPNADPEPMSETHRSSASDLREAQGRPLGPEQSWRALVDAPFPTLVLADDGEVLVVARSFTETVGWSLAEIPTLVALAAKTAAGEPSLSIDVAGVHAEGRVDHGEIRVRSKNGSVRVWCACSRSIGRLGDGRRAVITSAVDVTGRKRDEVERAALLEEAKRAAQSRDELLAIVSHDLKNPLASILLNAALLAKRLSPDDGSGRKRAETIRRSAAIMQRLIDRLLDAAKIEAGKLAIDIDPCDAKKILEDSLDVLRPLATSKSISIELRVAPDVPPIEADPERIAQVVSNLVGNAIKFTPAGGRIAVACDRVGDRVRFTVSDSGPGIPPDEVPHLFDRYWQSAKHTRLGAGLGLFIAKGIVDAHGGSIAVDSERGRGTTFTFTVRAAASA